jgi:hypothetical protein
MKPIAWMMIRNNEFFDAIHPDEHARHEGDYTVPLYTAPKPIPEDELWKIFKQHTNGLDYARAIEEYHGIK